MNPYNSIHNTPTNTPIKNITLQRRWRKIQQHLNTTPRVVEAYGKLKINDLFYVAQGSQKMRLYSYLDWVYYEPQQLAQAMNMGSVEQYYMGQLDDPQSPHNQWKRTQQELELKTYYAERAGRTHNG